MDMQSFERIYMRTLRQIYDTEQQLLLSLHTLSTPSLDARLAQVLSEMSAQSGQQLTRLEDIFRILYQEPRGDAAWVATALLREAWDATLGNRLETDSQGCAAALLALKRYELTLYETLLRWSEQCDLEEALPAIRRSLAEELLQASVLSCIAFDKPDESVRDAGKILPASERRALN